METNCKTFTWCIEPNDNVVMVTGFLSLLLAFGLMMATICNVGRMNTEENLAAIKAGLVQVPNAGAAGYHWGKP